jgi:toxin HigB-1
MTNRVVITITAKKQLIKAPRRIAVKLLHWARSVELLGLEEVRKIPGFHDEPLKGERYGQRAIRLNRAYRAIYIIKNDSVEFVSVEEVTKHDY